MLSGKSKKSAAIFLAVCLFCLHFASCAETEPTVEPFDTMSESEALGETLPAIEAETEAAASALVLDEDYTILYPNDASDDISAASKALSDAFQSAGIALGISTDRLAEHIPSDAKEILVGSTNRAESAKMLSSLKKDDFEIAVSGIRIVILGGSDTATVRAVDKFIELFFRSDKSDFPSIPSDFRYCFSEAYPIDNLTVGGTPISRYQIVISEKADAVSAYAASLLSSLIAEKSGVVLPIVSDSTKVSVAEIRIGETSRGKPDKMAKSCYRFAQEGESVQLSCAVCDSLAAVRALVSALTIDADGKAELIPSGTFSGKNEKAVYPTISELQGKMPVVLTDQKNAAAVVCDISAQDPCSDEAILWTWSPAGNGFSALGYANRIDDAKLRYSEVLGKYVLCVTSSPGFIGVAEYPSGKKIWETCASSLGPHAIEYLPSGVVACALSGNSHTENGCIRLYGYTENAGISSDFVSDRFESAHGVLWDETLGILWALGLTELRAYDIGGTPASPTLTRIEGLGGTLPTIGGHDLSPVSGNDTELWISSRSVYRFHKETGTFDAAFDGSRMITASNVKSIGGFPDGTVIRSVAASVYAAYDTDTLHVFLPDGKGGYQRKDIVYRTRAFYKAKPFLPSYSGN